MPRFNFRLQTLLRLREQLRDQRREELAKAFQADAMLADRRDSATLRLVALKEDYRAASGVGEVRVDRLLVSQRCEVALRVEIRQIEEQRRVLAEEIEKRRAALVEADRQVRVLEKLKAKQYERFLHEERLRENKEIDEVAGRKKVHAAV